MGKTVRGRFAPSPSGRMHFGNLWAAVLGWLIVRHAGGEMILRIEDLDPDRCRSEYADLLMEDLHWLGLDWDNQEIIRQSARTEAYTAAFGKLQETCHVYPCFCTRAERLAARAPHRSDGLVVYPGTCRNLSAEERERLAQVRRPAWRIEVPDRTIAFRDLCRGEVRMNLAEEFGDFILRRSDGVYAYQLAVVTDDAEAGVNLVVRGSDLLSSTPAQIWLQEMLGVPHPQYFHVPLLLDSAGRRLSKRDKDLDMGALRARFRPEELLGKIARLAGFGNGEPVGTDELLRRFRPEAVPDHDLVLPGNFPDGC